MTVISMNPFLVCAYVRLCERIFCYKFFELVQNETVIHNDEAVGTKNKDDNDDEEKEDQNDD